jgi:hypothetical protein
MVLTGFGYREGPVRPGSAGYDTDTSTFTPAKAKKMQLPRANTDPHNSHNTQHTRVKQYALCLI